MAAELFAGLVKMVAIEVQVAKRVDEFARPQPGDLGHHHGQQRVAGDVEGNAQKHVGAPLVELAGEPIAGDIELEQQVTRGQGHLIELGTHSKPKRSAGVICGLVRISFSTQAIWSIVPPSGFGQERHWCP